MAKKDHINSPLFQSCQVSRFTRESPGFFSRWRPGLTVGLENLTDPIKMVLCAWISASPPQFVGQTKQVGQYSLHSRAILAYYKEKWDKFCQFCEKLC